MFKFSYILQINDIVGAVVIVVAYVLFWLRALLFKMVTVKLSGDRQELVVDLGHFIPLLPVLLKADVHIPQLVWAEIGTSSSDGPGVHSEEVEIRRG